jgi:putative hemolysin
LFPLILYSGLIVFFIILSAFFSAAETAYIAVNRQRLKYQEEAGDRKAGAIHRIASNPDRLLGVILFGVNVAEIAAAGLVTSLVISYSAPEYKEIAAVAGSIFFSFIVLILCELTPKIIAAARPEQLSRNLLPPVRFFIIVLSPFARFSVWLANGLVRLAGLSAAASPFQHGASQEEIKAMIAGAGEASVPSTKKHMLHNVFEIDTKQIREVMIPRGEVTAVDIGDSLADILDIVSKTNYSRIPVYRKDFDNPLGVLHVKDLLQYLPRKDADINIHALLRPVHFVPDSARLDVVLRRLQAMHLHLAVVVDEFGGVAGIVTLENLLEEIVGEIRDEYDAESESVRKIDPDTYSIAGNLPIRDFNRSFSDKIPEAPEYATIAGFLESLTGRLLREGETVHYENLVFTIEKTEGFRINTICVRTGTSPDTLGDL